MGPRRRSDSSGRSLRTSSAGCSGACPTCLALPRNAGTRQFRAALSRNSPAKSKDTAEVWSLPPDVPQSPPSLPIQSAPRRPFDFSRSPNPTSSRRPSGERQSPNVVTPQHSGLGIASFVIALLVLGLDAILVVIMVVGIARPTQREREDVDQREPRNAVLRGAVALYCLNCLSVPLCLV